MVVCFDVFVPFPDSIELVQKPSKDELDSAAICHKDVHDNIFHGPRSFRA